MDPPFAGRAALLLALRQGPGYGVELVDRVFRLTGRRLPLGSVYPTLETLRFKGFLRKWKVVPGGRRGGRSRTYYELTYKGLLQVQADVRVLTGLVERSDRGPLAPIPTPQLLRKRLERVGALTDFVGRLGRVGSK
jgi:DNA-binding PadR family transcriptional regulator